MPQPKDNVDRVVWGRGHVRHGRVPDWVLDSEVSDRAVRLYVVLGRYADDTGLAYPSKKVLTERLRCARSTLDAALRELVQIEALTVEPTTRSDGSPGVNNYVLHWSDSRRTSSDPSEDLLRDGDPLRARAVPSRERKEPNEEKPSVAVAKPRPRNLPFDSLVEVCPGTDAEVDAGLVGKSLAEIRKRLVGESKNAALPRSSREVARALLEIDDKVGKASNAELAQEIRNRAGLYSRKWPTAELTPSALAKHFTRVLAGGKAKRPSDYARMFDGPAE